MEIVASTLVGSGIEALLNLRKKRANASGSAPSSEASEPFFDAIIVDEATQVPTPSRASLPPVPR